MHFGNFLQKIFKKFRKFIIIFWILFENFWKFFENFDEFFENFWKSVSATKWNPGYARDEWISDINRFRFIWAWMQKQIFRLFNSQEEWSTTIYLIERSNINCWSFYLYFNFLFFFMCFRIFCLAFLSLDDASLSSSCWELFCQIILCSLF